MIEWLTEEMNNLKTDLLVVWQKDRQTDRLNCDQAQFLFCDCEKRMSDHQLICMGQTCFFMIDTLIWPVGTNLTLCSTSVTLMKPEKTQKSPIKT